MASNSLAQDLDDILVRTDDLWDELRSQRIFITGGTGFFGCWLLESLIWANDKLGLNAEVVVLTRNYDAFRNKAPHLANHPSIQFIIGDVTSFNFPEGNFSHVIHAATEASAKLNEENPLLMFETIVQGTRHTLEFAKLCQAKKFLLTSSGAVYGKQPSDLTHIPEDYMAAPDLTHAQSAYGEGKRAAEMFCTLYGKQYGFETKIARCFAFVGPYLPLDTHFAIGNFIRDGLQGCPILVNGDGTPYRSYLYAADLAIWLWTILLKGQSCYPYNVGSDFDLSISRIAHLVAQVFQPQVEVIIAQKPLAGKEVERYVPLTNRALLDLGLKSMIGLEDAIKRTILSVISER
ncbi:NAD-dependent epimerase/dehydratase [Planktothrix agardhii NIES-204]|jgi:dTDP-glucose 4,6-dehydratase|nr:NAD-dependent epimerase/dehydratase [Planktothrix agardhii NIES-204]